jgi:hypothetical protein
VVVSNRGLNKVWFKLECSQAIRVSPAEGVISEKGKARLTVSFRPSKLSKQYYELIAVHFKGSHVLHIPFKVNTLEPNISCKEALIDFQTGYLNQVLTSSLTLLNHNAYPCNLRFAPTELLTPQEVHIEANSEKTVEVQLAVRAVGESVVKLPDGFIELRGYGAIRCPREYRVTGRKTVLQLIPDDPFKDLVFSLASQTTSFRLRNLSQRPTAVELRLRSKTEQSALILSC